MFQQLKKFIGRNKTLGTAVVTGNQGAEPVNIDLSDGAAAGVTPELPNAQGVLVDSKWLKGSNVSFGIQGMLHDKSWKHDRAAASRSYFSGEEVRRGAGIAVDPQAGTIIMSRPRKEILEKYAYLLFTHSN